MKKLAVMMVCGAFANSAFAWGDKCKHEREIETSVAMQSASKLYVEAGAGELHIEGENRDDVLIRAKLCADDEEVLAKMDVRSEVDGGSARIRTEFPQRGWLGNSDYQASIDLELVVPKSMQLDVEDSSGEASVENVASLSMKDSSGELEISDIAGDVSVLDSSGRLSIKAVGGNVDVTDSSGGMYVSKVKGDFVVDADSSGEIEVSDVGRSVLIKQDSSGAIEVDGVGGDFSVLADTSGGIRYDNVGGKVSLPD